MKTWTAENVGFQGGNNHTDVENYRRKPPEPHNGNMALGTMSFLEKLTSRE